MAPDVVVRGVPIHVEVKTGKAPPIWRALEQAQRDAERGLMPVAVCRRDGEAPVVAMAWDDWIEMLQAAAREWRR